MKEYYFKEEIYYRKNDFKRERETLIFIHGVSGSSSAWLPYEKIFEEKYNILTYDIRGHGLSKKYQNYADYKIENLAKDLNALVTYLNISKFILISNSFGSLIHLEYLKSHQENAIANIFTSPEVYLGEMPLTKIMRPILTLIKWTTKIIPFNSKPRGHIDYNKHKNSTDWNIKRNLADMRNTGLRAHFYTLKQSVNKGQEYNLNKIKKPTLIIHGEKDTMVPIKNVIKMKKEIENSEFIEIPNVDHNTAHNAVKEISEAVESFLKRKIC